MISLYNAATLQFYAFEVWNALVFNRLHWALTEKSEDRGAG